MAKFFEFTQQQQQEFDEWTATRPLVIQEMIKKIKPNVLYRLKDTGQRVFVAAYSENGTVTVVYSGEYNLVDFERKVFGINPEDLEECELPLPDEKVGVICDTPEKVEALIEERRKLPAMRKRIRAVEKANKAHLN